MRPLRLHTFFFPITNKSFKRKGLAYLATVSFLETPLSVAVTKDNACEMIVTLVNGGALLDYRTKEGLTPLHRAAASGKAMSVKVLIVFNCSSVLFSTFLLVDTVEISYCYFYCVDSLRLWSFTKLQRLKGKDRSNHI